MEWSAASSVWGPHTSKVIDSIPSCSTGQNLEFECLLYVLCRERAILISNHPSEVDWLAFWSLAYRKGVLGSLKVVLKNVCILTKQRGALSFWLLLWCRNWDLCLGWDFLWTIWNSSSSGGLGTSMKHCSSSELRWVLHALQWGRKVAEPNKSTDMDWRWL